MSRMWDRSEQTYWILCGEEWLVMRVSNDRPVCTWPRFYQDSEAQYDVCFAKDDATVRGFAEAAFRFVEEDLQKDDGVAQLCLVGPGGKVLDIGSYRSIL